MSRLTTRLPGRAGLSLFFSLLSLTSVRATTLADNLGATTVGTELAYGNTWLAATFTTGSSAYSLTGADLLLSSAGPGQAELALYTDLRGQPGMRLAGLASPAAYPNALAVTSFASGGYALSAGASYWLVLRAVSGEFAWAWTDSTTGTGPGLLSRWAVTDDAGGSWFVSGVQPFQLRVEATPLEPVPEPGTLAALLLSLGAFAVLHWHRRAAAGNVRPEPSVRRDQQPVAGLGAGVLLPLLTIIGTALTPTPARAATVTLTLDFTQDDTVQLFDVAIATSGSVDFRNYGYGGGTLSTGQTIAPGGFDTILSLFSASGALLAESDDGEGSGIDPATGKAYDARLTTGLDPGRYILALTQYDNFAIGPNLANGFAETGNPSFTADPRFSTAGPCPGNRFRDPSGTTGRCRSGSATIEFINVESATPRVEPDAVPEPATALLLLGGFALLAVDRRKRA